MEKDWNIRWFLHRNRDILPDSGIPRYKNMLCNLNILLDFLRRINQVARTLSAVPPDRALHLSVTKENLIFLK